MKNRTVLHLWLNIVVLLLTLSAASFAWFANDTRKLADVSPLSIDRPPNINILNNETKSIDILNLDGLQVGNTDPYDIVFSVSVPPSVANVRAFQLQLAYTSNLKETIELYPVTYLFSTETPESLSSAESQMVAAAGTDLITKQSRHPNGNGNYVTFYYEVTNDALLYRGAPDAAYSSIGDGYTVPELDASVTQGNNQVLYKYYEDADDIDGTSGTFDFRHTGRVYTDHDDPVYGSVNYLFYVLRISWPDGDRYLAGIDSKETDLICISAKGK